jgi:hypothetical protein
VSFDYLANLRKLKEKNFFESLIKGYGRIKRLGYTGLNSRLTDGSKFGIPTHQPRSTAQKHYFTASGTRFH